MELSELVKDAAWFGLAVGVIAMGAYLLIVVARYLLAPTVAVAAATVTKPNFGFMQA